MIDRRSFTAVVAAVMVTPRIAWSQMTSSKTVFYASVGPALTRYQIDIDGAGLTRQDTVTLPANIQYVWRHPSAPFLYVATSNGGSSSLGIKGDRHFLSALRIDPASGALTDHGSPAALASRPIHMSLDGTGAYALVAYNNPSGVTVHRIAADGTVGEEIKQADNLDSGIFAHQIRTTPANDAAILVTRGNDAAGRKPEDPGALKLFSFKDGQLANQGSVAPDGGYGFGPRHLDFHPSLPFVYVSLERENKLNVYRLRDGVLDPQALFSKGTLAEPGNIRSRQAASTVHLHPNGRYAYVGNRASDTVDFAGNKVFPGGENNIAVFAIDPASGEPTLIQNADVHGIHPRTFSLDPTASMLVVANLQTMRVRDGDEVKTVPANLATYHVGSDGKLTFAHSYDVDTGDAMQFWSGMVAIG
jgi:6-phosphogluconolactonase